MKGYGLPRDLDIEFPDKLDIQNFGLKTSTGQIKSKGGDYRGSVKRKRRVIARRILKKRERSIEKRMMLKELEMTATELELINEEESNEKD